jgi:predicted GNAT family acetyltransferase
MPRVCAVDETNAPAMCAFLEQHADTAMFLLSNFAMNGPRVGTLPTSGNFKLVEEDGEVCAVICLTRRTLILAEAGGRTELAPTIVEACRAEPIPIGGVIGEWTLASAIWAILRTQPSFRQVLASKDILQALHLSPVTRSDRTPQVRLLRLGDFEQWDGLNAAFCAEEGIPLWRTVADRQTMFQQNTERRRWWGYFEDGRLVSMACLNAVYKHIGQVGGVYTVPDRRCSGLSRATMNALLADSVSVHGLERIILFTGEHNHAAQHLYETLGFSRIGDFAVLMCEPIT